MSKAGYSPWVARKPPMFNTSLNTTYIKISSASLMAIPVLIVGVLLGLTLPKIIVEIPAIVKAKPLFATTAPTAIVTNTSIKKAEVPVLVKSPSFTVPEIPVIKPSVQTNVDRSIKTSEPEKSHKNPDSHTTESGAELIVLDSNTPDSTMLARV